MSSSSPIHNCADVGGGNHSASLRLLLAERAETNALKHNLSRGETAMSSRFRFDPISFSWVAIHPEPKGVIQFIGGAFFGTFPTVFYRYFLQTLFEEGYTIIALPFRFSFRHWAIAIDLLKEQETLRHHLLDITGNHFYQAKENYFWLGHSLGCKYIALLEFLSGAQWSQITETCVGRQAYRQIEAILVNANLENASILSQPSLLIAPDISDTESAIPVRAIERLFSRVGLRALASPAATLVRFLDRSGLGVLPTRTQTQCFIASSLLFNLTAIISFAQDEVAGSRMDEFKGKEIQDNSDVLWLIKQLQARNFPLLHIELQGKHLEPVGLKIGDCIVDLNPFDKFIKLLNHRQLERDVIEILAQLRQRQSQLEIGSDSAKGSRLSIEQSHLGLELDTTFNQPVQTEMTDCTAFTIVKDQEPKSSNSNCTRRVQLSLFHHSRQRKSTEEQHEVASLETD